MRPRTFTVAALFVWMASISVLGGCRSEECARMEVCCQALEGMEGIGGACERASAAVGEPQTCRTVLETVHLMFEKRDDEPPEACRDSPEG